MADVWAFGGQWGYYTDVATGLVLCTNRYYDPAGGRWLTRDPVGYAGGINLYGYTANNPVNEIDPSGTDAIDNTIVVTLTALGEMGGGVLGAGGGGAAGFGVGAIPGAVVGAGVGGAAGAASGLVAVGLRHAILNILNWMSGPGGGIESGPGSPKDQYPDRYNGPKPQYDNPGTHDEAGGNFRGGGSRTTPLPEDAQEVYENKAIPDNAGKNWYGRGKDGDIYRYQPGGNGNHFNGREFSPRGISVPSECRARLGPTGKPPRGLR